MSVSLGPVRTLVVGGMRGVAERVGGAPSTRLAVADAPVELTDIERLTVARAALAEAGVHIDALGVDGRFMSRQGAYSLGTIEAATLARQHARTAQAALHDRTWYLDSIERPELSVKYGSIKSLNDLVNEASTSRAVLQKRVDDVRREHQRSVDGVERVITALGEGDVASQALQRISQVLAEIGPDPVAALRAADAVDGAAQMLVHRGAIG